MFNPRHILRTLSEHLQEWASVVILASLGFMELPAAIGLNQTGSVFTLPASAVNGACSACARHWAEIESVPSRRIPNEPPTWTEAAQQVVRRAQ